MRLIHFVPGLFVDILLMEETPNYHLGCIEPVFFLTDDSPYQLVNPGFLNHQQIDLGSGSSERLLEHCQLEELQTVLDPIVAAAAKLAKEPTLRMGSLMGFTESPKDF